MIQKLNGCKSQINGLKYKKGHEGAVKLRNEHSYQDNVKALAMLREKQPKVSVVEVYAQMMLDELVINQRVKQLRVLIDESLDQKNKEQFMLLSEEYQRLNR